MHNCRGYAIGLPNRSICIAKIQNAERDDRQRGIDTLDQQDIVDVARVGSSEGWDDDGLCELVVERGEDRAVDASTALNTVEGELDWERVFDWIPVFS